MKKLFCFDLDGTVTKAEILPLIASEVGLYEEISALTEATIKGIIPFRQSFLLRCKLLSDASVSAVSEAVKNVSLHESILGFIQNNRDHCCVITGNLDAWIQPLMERIGCQYFSSVASCHDDKLIHVDHVLDKGDVVRELKKSYDTIVAIGDGMGDVPMFECADIGIAFGGAHNPVESLIQYSDYLIYEETSLCRLLTTL